jgi:hypothetical protein
MRLKRNIKTYRRVIRPYLPIFGLARRIVLVLGRNELLCLQL